MTLGRLRLSVADARDLAQGALRGIGYHNDEARIIADHVIDAALCGYEYSGLAKILNLPETGNFGCRVGRWRCCARPTSRSPSTAATMSACSRSSMQHRRRSKNPQPTALRSFR